MEGDLRVGGEFRAHVFLSGWEGTGRVESCEPPRRLGVRMKDADSDYEELTDAVLTADGDHTILVVEQRGMPLALLAAYAAGMQLHVEDLAAYLAGREVRTMQSRWQEVLPAYQELAAGITD